MVGMVMATSTTSSTLVLPRVGPRPLVAAGMLLAAIGMLLLTGLGVRSTYTADILPALLALGSGLGLVFSTAMNTAAYGVAQPPPASPRPR
jgi:nitrate/nitrite transporter NarK